MTPQRAEVVAAALGLLDVPEQVAAAAATAGLSPGEHARLLWMLADALRLHAVRVCRGRDGANDDAGGA